MNIDKIKKLYSQTYKRYVLTGSDSSSDELAGMRKIMDCIGLDCNARDPINRAILIELSKCKTCGGETSTSHIRCPHCGCDSYEMFGNIHASDDDE